MKPEDWRVDPKIMRTRRPEDQGQAMAQQPQIVLRKSILMQPLAVWPLLDSFDKRSIGHRRTMVALMILLIGAVDYVTGYEASVASLYVLPVFLAGWSLGMVGGLISALGASTSIILTNGLAGQVYSAAWMPLWNIGVRGGTFAALAILANSLHEKMELSHRLSLSDTLTSAWNRRAFYQAFAVELARVARNPAPISLVYIDVDDFKAVNDGLGHSTGDEVLKAVANTCIRTLRLQDTVARLGGDEFAVLMPNTDEAVLGGLLNRLQEALGDGTKSTATVTFSIGAVTFVETPASVNSALHQADELMYRVKASGKGNILCGRSPVTEAAA